MNPLFRIDFSISDSLKIVRKSVLIYETIIVTNGSVSSDDGDIQIKDLRSLAGFKATSSDGDISIKKCDASGVDLNSDDGDVIYHRHNYNNDDGGSYQHNLHSKNVLIANSDEGDIKVNN